MSRKAFRVYLALSTLAGSAAVFCNFITPSEPRNAWLLGYSAARWALGLLTLALTALFAAALARPEKLRERLNAWLDQGDHAYFAFVGLLFLTFVFLWCFQFSWLFIPKNMRPLLLFLAFASASAAVLVRISFSAKWTETNYAEKYRLLPKLSSLSKGQKRVLLGLGLLSIVYIAVLMPSNINGSRDWADFKHYGGDEYVIYPILTNVMTPGEDFSATLYHHYVHEDYHYGYPFYAWSSFVLLPIRLIAGPDFLERIDLPLPPLRILVSVVPLMAGCLILVWLTTRFANIPLSAAVYVFLLTAPGSLQNNQGFWHPDGLNFFFICAALFFLNRDRLRYGRNFYLAAFFIGLSAAIRLYGFLFFLAIGVYLLYALVKKILPMRKVLVRAGLFLLVMFGTILWSSPYLFRSDARANMVAILTEKTGEMSSGYNADFNDPKNDYRPGWDAWYPAFEDHYTEMYCFFFLIASLAAACFVGWDQWTYRHLALWWVVIAVYLIWFVAVKSTQYVLPMMLPLMSCIFALPRALEGRSRKLVLPARIVSAAVWASQLVINVIKIAPRFR